jgi:predicted GNAT family acetyltransferase
MGLNTEVVVKHQVSRQRFYIELNGDEAVLEYRLINSQSNSATPIVDFTRTWVPPEFRGKSLAEKLVREGLKWARSESFEIQASCWYVAKFLRQSEK